MHAAALLKATVCALAALILAAPKSWPRRLLVCKVVVLPPSVNVGDECEVLCRKGAVLRQTGSLRSKVVSSVGPRGIVRILKASLESRRALVEVIDSPEVDPPPAPGVERAVPGSIGWVWLGSAQHGTPLIRPRTSSAMSEDEARTPSTRAQSSALQATGRRWT
eukprot:s17_g18.t1